MPKAPRERALHEYRPASACDRPAVSDPRTARFHPLRQTVRWCVVCHARGDCRVVSPESRQPYRSTGVIGTSGRVPGGLCDLTMYDLGPAIMHRIVDLDPFALPLGFLFPDADIAMIRHAEPVLAPH